MTWSANVVADDWKHINAFEVVRRTIARLDEKGKGIVLLHDIQPATALALPELLRQLKAKDYRIVLLEPGKGESVPVAARPAPPATEPATVQVTAKPAQVTTPRVVAPALPPAPAPTPVRWRRRQPPCPHLRPAPRQRSRMPRCTSPRCRLRPPTVWRAATTSRAIRCGRLPRNRNRPATCRRRAS